MSFLQLRSPRIQNPLANPAAAGSNVTVTPDVATLTLTSFAPTIQHVINAGLVALILTTFAPQVNLKVIPPVTALTLTTYAPQVNLTVIPSLSTQTLVGFAPSLALGDIPPTAAVTLTTYAPAAGLGVSDKIEFLQDDFEFGGIDDGKWGNYGGSQVVADTDLLLELSTSLGGNYVGILSSDSFNLTGSYAFTQLVDAGNQSITSYECYPIQLSNGSNALSIMVAGGNVYARKKITGTTTTVGSSVAYNSTTMKWFRIREASGTTYWDYATDPAGSWTNIASVANPITITSLQGEILVGTWQAEGSTTTAKVDHFNVIPESLQFDWKGYTWNKRVHAGDPSSNQWWSSNNVSGPDGSDYLTLQITNQSGSQPYGSEIFTEQRGFGYGTYTAVIGTRLDNMDQRIGFGNLFTFDFTAPPDYKEIDSAEVRNYDSNPNMRILHSHVYNNGGSREFITDDMDITADVVQTHRLIWEPGKITFDAFVGTGTGGTNYFHTEHTTNLPTPGLERVHFNLWSNTGVANYLNVSPVDVVIRDFTFSSNQTFTPGAAALTLTTYAPTVTASAGSNTTVTPDVAALALTTYAPQVNLAVIPPVNSLTLATFAPSVTASDHKTVTPSALALNLASFAPQVNLSVVPPVTTLVLATYAPTVNVVNPGFVSPITAVLVLTTYAPTVTRSVAARSYFIDSDANVYWVINQDLGLIERV